MEAILVAIAVCILVFTGVLIVVTGDDPNFHVHELWWVIAVAASTYLFTKAGSHKDEKNKDREKKEDHHDRT
jgi:predicted tellurium resistance membrane protein TerC